MEKAKTFYESISEIDPKDPWKNLGALEYMEETEQQIREVCNNICEMLIAKNRAYGDSALNPRRIFSRADPIEQINVRMDDKLSRISNTPDGQADPMGEEPEKDLVGYLILKMVARMRRKAALEAQRQPGRRLEVDHKTPTPYADRYDVSAARG